MVDSQTYDMLQKRYGSTCLPLEIVRQHYLSHLGMPSLLRALGKGKLTLRVVKGDWGGRLQRVVYLHDLARWLDQGGN
ncbi:pyocin activator PrtN family protein [Pseudomonas sp. MYb187]|nr:transcriptional regulator [Pseudomonas sp. MYb187]